VCQARQSYLKPGVSGGRLCESVERSGGGGASKPLGMVMDEYVLEVRCWQKKNTSKETAVLSYIHCLKIEFDCCDV
jgi:hypothetical protein